MFGVIKSEEAYKLRSGHWQTSTDWDELSEFEDDAAGRVRRISGIAGEILGDRMIEFGADNYVAGTVIETARGAIWLSTDVAPMPPYENRDRDLAAQMIQAGNSPPSVDDFEIATWFERDRAHVDLRNKYTDETVMEWWDEDVGSAVEDGILDPRDWLGSAFDAADRAGLIAPS